MLAAGTILKTGFERKSRKFGTPGKGGCILFIIRHNDCIVAEASIQAAGEDALAGIHSPEFCSMVKIEAIIRHHKIDDIKNALVSAGFHGMTVTEVRGFGRQKGQKETYRGAEYKIDFVPKLKLEIVASKENRDKIIATIIKTAQTGQIGDGKIFVSEIAEVIRIRTAETGTTAL